MHHVTGFSHFLKLDRNPELKKKNVFVYLAVLCLIYSMWELVPGPGIETRPPPPPRSPHREHVIVVTGPPGTSRQKFLHVKSYDL